MKLSTETRIPLPEVKSLRGKSTSGAEEICILCLVIFSGRLREKKVYKNQYIPLMEFEYDENTKILDTAEQTDKMNEQSLF